MPVLSVASNQTFCEPRFHPPSRSALARTASAGLVVSSIVTSAPYTDSQFVLYIGQPPGLPQLSPTENSPTIGSAKPSAPPFQPLPRMHMRPSLAVQPQT